MKLHYLLIAIAFLGLQSSKAEESDNTGEAITIDAPCFDTNQLFTELKIKFKESPIIMGIASDQVKSTMSFWINPVDETWTIVATKKDTSCVIGSGANFKVVPTKKTIGI